MSTVRELQVELKNRGLDTTGKKAELVKRLEEAKAEDSEDEEDPEKAGDNKQGEPEPEDDRTWTRAVKFFRDCKASCPLVQSVVARLTGLVKPSPPQSRSIAVSAAS